MTPRTPHTQHTAYVQNRLVSVCLAPIQATPGSDPLPRPLAELKQWLHGLPPAQRTSSEARLLDRLCEAPGQALAWNAPAIDHALRGSVPASKAEIEQLHRECLKLLDRHPARGLWTVHLTTGSQPGDLPGIRLAPGGMMLGYLRELRCTPEGQRPG